RKPTYMIFFALGAILYVALTFTGTDHLNSIAMFVACCLIIISMYGGGFATIPAYLRDLFGVMHVSAIHGRLLTAWSVAGVAGPFLVNALREHQLRRGVPVADAYWFTLYIMAGLLVLGFIANLMVRPVDPKYFIERRRDAGPQMPPGFAQPHPR
ncbi:MAG TPA: hypothetical protein VG269_28080, partial [Tepidisphaeraceae bacterium]|nr:hypothetical protein [Tepidisphaeraceae bacterium]